MNPDDIIKDYKTRCCNSSYKRKGRAKYVCSKCMEDVTLELVFIYMALDDEQLKIYEK